MIGVNIDNGNKSSETIKYRSYALHNFKKIPQIARLSEDQIEAIEVVGQVLPFKTNSYVIEELINWDNIPDDPIFILNFPQKDMLQPHHYEKMKRAIDSGMNKIELKKVANEIRMELNPHPAGQMELNVPEVDGVKLTGVQHKYRETLLFFPSQGQTCHAYCTFCFRWPQFVGMDEMKFAMRETELLVKYLQRHPEVTDVLFTGGDPLIMKPKLLINYLQSLLDADLPNLHTIRLGTKALGYWPYKFLTDEGADELLAMFKKVVDSGKVLAFMSHFNHPVELETPAVQHAIQRITETGAQIRSQSPILRKINDKADDWAKMWRLQVDLGIIPYYMFLVRDTGAQHYFNVPIVEAWHVFREAYQKVSGICRTVRGPSMSSTPGKVQMLGVSEINGKKVMSFRMLQGRNPDWVCKPFFAEYDESAVWVNDLKPAFGEDKFFFEEELEENFNISIKE